MDGTLMQNKRYARLSLGAELVRIINDEFVISTNVDERVLVVGRNLVSNKRCHVESFVYKTQ